MISCTKPETPHGKNDNDEDGEIARSVERRFPFSAAVGAAAAAAGTAGRKDCGQVFFAPNRGLGLRGN